jgi:tetratricopeptide (TPR) repeat protein
LSYRDTLVRAALIAAAVLLGSAVLQACGPFFPRWLVTDEALILEAPTTWLKDALEQRLPTAVGSALIRTRPQIRPTFKAVVPEQGPHRQTAEVDQRDLETATSNRTLTAKYAEVRELLAQYGDAVAAWRQEAAWSDPPPPRPQPPADLTVPVGLPGEFEDYLRGAIAYHQGRFQDAQGYWTRLLERPAAQRRLRSTWAAYMLGRLSLWNDPETGVPIDPEGAVQWFERTRELTDKGFPDPLGLAAASLGWQARAELALKRPERALVLYLQQVRAGDPRAVQSIRTTSFKLLNEPESLKRIAASDEARPIMNAYVVSRWDRVDYDGPLDPAPARKWLEAIRAVQPRNVTDADRLAWVCYRAGDFACAEEWLKRASGPMTHWIQAKLLMRAGKLKEAELPLVLAGAPLPKDPGPEHDAFNAYENQVHPALAPHVQGDRGAALLAQGNYKDALYPLLTGGYWSDAAYIAERVLTTDELLTYVDQSWPVALASHRPEEYGDGWTMLYAGIVTPDKERIAYGLRYLVGRRLAREGRYQEAEKFLPAPLGGSLKLLAGSLAEGRDESRAPEERSRALFRSACVTRYQGLALLGTELDPDWFLYEGQYENDSFAKTRARGKFTRLGPTEDEKKRARESEVKPAKRFHYRYRGMELAKEAAALLPDGTVEKARILATAGNWVEGRDPEAARPFLDAILSCCGGTEIGQRARRVNAIPNIGDACEASARGAGDSQ